jgi:BTB/POZ domain
MCECYKCVTFKKVNFAPLFFSFGKNLKWPIQKLSQNLLEILDDNEYYYITIEVCSDPYVRIFRAHMVILNYRSPYLRRILSTNKKKSDEILINIKLPNISPEFFHVLLRYYYFFFYIFILSCYC